MARPLYDTDVLIDHLQDASKAIRPEVGGAYSSISRAELYSSPDVDETVIDELLANFEEIPVGRDIAQEAGRIRRSVRVKLPDALIAATAITSKRRLVTRNVGDFKKIPSLRMGDRNR